MTDSQNIVVIITSVTAAAGIFFAAFDVRTSNGRTARAFSNLLAAIALGIALVTYAELGKFADSRVEMWLIVAGRVIQVGGVIYFMLHLRRKAKAGLHDTVTPGKTGGR